MGGQAGAPLGANGPKAWPFSVPGAPAQRGEDETKPETRISNAPEKGLDTYRRGGGVASIRPRVCSSTSAQTGRDVKGSLVGEG